MSPLMRREALAAYLFISLTIIGLIVFNLWPVLASLYYSFTEWDLFGAPKWIGVENYGKLLSDNLFKISLVNTSYYSVGSVSISVVLGLLLALLMNQGLKGRSVFRSLFFLPNITPAVAVGVVWAWMYAPEFGLLDVLFKNLGLRTIPWLRSTKWAMPSVIIMGTWGSVGYNMVIFLAGLQNIPGDYYEAARIDGAGSLQCFRWVTLPLLSPTTFFIVVISLIGSFQLFSAVYVMTAGGPGTSTLTMILYLYRNGFQYFRMGYASAIAYALFVLLLALTIAQFRLQRLWVYYELV